MKRWRTYYEIIRAGLPNVVINYKSLLWAFLFSEMHKAFKQQFGVPILINLEFGSRVIGSTTMARLHPPRIQDMACLISFTRSVW